MDGDSQATALGTDAAAEPVSMLVEGTVVTMDAERRVISDGASIW